MLTGRIIIFIYISISCYFNNIAQNYFSVSFVYLKTVIIRGNEKMAYRGFCRII